MPESTLRCFSFGCYTITEKCPVCGHSHAAGPSHIIVHDSRIREALAPSRGEVPKCVVDAYSRWCSSRVGPLADAISTSVYMHAGDN